MLFVIQEDRHCMPTSDYYFTNIQPDPIVIPPHRENNSGSTSQQAAAKNQIHNRYTEARRNQSLSLHAS